MFDKCKECIHGDELFGSSCNNCCEKGFDMSNFESKYDKLINDKFRKVMRNEIRDVKRDIL